MPVAKAPDVPASTGLPEAPNAAAKNTLAGTGAPEAAREPEATSRHAALKQKPAGKHAEATKAPKQPKQPVAPAAPKIVVAPATPAPAAAKAKAKVNVPSTAHVHIEVPPGLQAELDRDPRMQPWANQVVSVIDRCCADTAKTSAVSGTIEVQITMHENQRPDADIKKLPPALTPIVGCATGGLMRAKMPLFTGAEGAHHVVRIQLK